MSMIHSKSKEVRFDTNSAIHLHTDLIFDITQHSQGTSRSHGIPTSDNETVSNSDSIFGTNFPFVFGQIQRSSSIRFPKQTFIYGRFKCVS